MKKTVSLEFSSTHDIPKFFPHFTSHNGNRIFYRVTMLHNSGANFNSPQTFCLRYYSLMNIIVPFTISGKRHNTSILYLNSVYIIATLLILTRYVTAFFKIQLFFLFQKLKFYKYALLFFFYKFTR